MTRGTPAPPRLARLWLNLVLPREEREFYIGDLDEGFDARCRAEGRRAARRWYWTEALAAPIRGLVRPPEPAAHRARRPIAGRVALDVRSAFRQFKAAPIISVTTVRTLAIGISATTAIFTVINAVWLKPLALAGADRLVLIRESKVSDPDDTGASYPTFLSWQSARTLSRLAIVGPTSATVETSEGRERVAGWLVSADFFATVGLRAGLGRTLDSLGARGAGADGITGLMLTDTGWRRRFGSDRSVIDRVVRVDGKPVRIVGVTPADVLPLTEEPIEFIAPAALLGGELEPGSANASRTYRGYTGVVARLAPGAGLSSARAELETIHAALAASFPQALGGRTVRVDPLRDVFVSGASVALATLLVVVSLVLLIGCVNVNHVLLARSVVRRREIGVRRALGASTMDLVRQLLIESAWLAAVGGALGVIGSLWLVQALTALAPGALPRLSTLTPDWRVWSFAAIVTTIAGLAAGILPALAAVRLPALASLSGARTSAGPGERRTSRLLLVGQVALAMTLMTFAGLLLNSLIRLTRVDPGFATAHILTIRLNLGDASFDGPLERPLRLNRVLDDISAQVAELPGVSGVAFAQSVPLTGIENGTRFTRPESPGTPATSAQLRFVSRGYASVLGIPIVAGREFTDRDGPGAEPVMLVNETFVRMFLSDRDPLGAVLQLGWGGEAPRRIVGVVGDVRHRDLADAPRPEMYVPQAQFANRQVTMVVRASNREAAAAITPRLRDTVRGVTSAAAVTAVMPLDEYRRQALAVPRFTTTLLVLFGGAALLLTLVGLGGTTAFTTAQRRREIGIRLALGANATAVERLIVRQGLVPVLAGVALGLVIVAAASRGVSTWLYDVTPADPATMAAVSTLLLVTAAIACALPARRATRPGVIASIRQEQENCDT